MGYTINKIFVKLNNQNTFCIDLNLDKNEMIQSMFDQIYQNAKSIKHINVLKTNLDELNPAYPTLGVTYKQCINASFLLHVGIPVKYKEVSHRKRTGNETINYLLTDNLVLSIYPSGTKFEVSFMDEDISNYKDRVKVSITGDAIDDAVDVTDYFTLLRMSNIFKNYGKHNNSEEWYKQWENTTSFRVGLIDSHYKFMVV